ncbi:MAG: DUF1648 domain-containing protein [Ignavibacteriales bacterium]|nr:DUF1648 domain-containing protein [Ignavibacteriales bacterium]
MSNTRYAAIIFIMALILSLTLPVFYYSHLPETVASHFNFKNDADAWMSKKTFFIIQILIILFTSVLIGGFAFLINRLPESFLNLPNKDYWLSKERKDETVILLKKFMLWFGTLTLGFLTIVMQEVYAANIAGINKIKFNLWIYLIIYLTTITFMIIKLISHFNKTDK